MAKEKPCGCTLILDTGKYPEEYWGTRPCKSHAPLYEMLSFVTLVSNMKTEEEFGEDAPPSEDWICTLNELIASARKLKRKYSEEE
jgi:hypothetical protein